MNLERPAKMARMQPSLFGPSITSPGIDICAQALEALHVYSTTYLSMSIDIVINIDNFDARQAHLPIGLLF